MKIIGQWWQRISNGGIRPDHDFETAKKIRIINRCCVASIVVSSAYVIFFVCMGSAYLAPFDFMIALCCSVALILVRRTNYQFAAHIFLLTVPISLLLIDWNYGKLGTEYYYFPILILCYYIFNRRSILYFYLGLMLTLIVLAKFFEAGVNPAGQNFDINHLFYYFNICCSFIIGGALLRLFVHEHLRHQKEMEEKNLQLETAIGEVTQRNEEITVLIKELNHRTKNNLQLVSSLMNIQMERLPESEARSMLEDARTRIASIALLHQKLYRSDSMTVVSIGEFTADLIAHLRDIFEDKEHPVSIDCNVDNFRLNIDYAVTLGLILNELLTNSFKHGLAGVTQKKIQLSIQRQDSDLLKMKFCDNGTGISRAMEPSSRGAFGLELVRVLVKQMQGEMAIDEVGMNQVNILLHLNHHS